MVLSPFLNQRLVLLMSRERGADYERLARLARALYVPTLGS